MSFPSGHKPSANDGIEGLLEQIATSLSGTGAITTTPATSARTPSFTAATSSGSVAAGAKSVTFIFSSDFAGTLLGTTIDPTLLSTLSFADQAGLAAFAYTRSAGTVYIAAVV